MSDRKILFFDVDGTLLSEKTKEFPDSARTALERARVAGHLVFINSGRSWCNLQETRKLIPVDGFLCGCGTHVVVGDETIYHHQIPHDEGVKMRRDILACGLDGVLEGADACYMNRDSRIERVRHLRETLSQREGVLSPLSWEDESFDFDKCFLSADESSDPAALFEQMKSMDIIDRGAGDYECVPKGHSKATAMDLVLKHYNLPLEAAWVFGDSSNDLAMFEFAQNSVAMGEHSPVLDPYATFVTKTVEEDGIAWALEKLGIIE